MAEMMRAVVLPGPGEKLGRGAAEGFAVATDKQVRGALKALLIPKNKTAPKLGAVGGAVEGESG